MDDGYWSFSFILFLAFILLEAAFYGFGAAIQNLNQGNLEKEMEQGSRKAEAVSHGQSALKACELHPDRH